MDTLEKLIEEFKKFPGIGPRQARRFAYHLLHASNEESLRLSDLITKLKGGIATCQKCFRFFALPVNLRGDAEANQSRQNFCSICLDPNRDQSTLMIVTTDTDVNAIEQRRMFNGLYFVMGKNAELTSADPLGLPRLKDLEKQFVVSDKIGDEIIARKNIREIILAMNANTEGEHTADIIKTYLKKLPALQGVKITSLGRGLSTGTELEYSDVETLKSAIENRR